jgi:hypothetical protein
MKKIVSLLGLPWLEVGGWRFEANSSGLFSWSSLFGSFTEPKRPDGLEKPDKLNMGLLSLTSIFLSSVSTLRFCSLLFALCSLLFAFCSLLFAFCSLLLAVNAMRLALCAMLIATGR